MKKAIVIGIDTYTSVSPLKGCVNDANKIASLLEKESSGFLTKAITNEAATRATIRREIQWCLNDADFSIIYFAGHGIKTPVSTFLASYDYSEDDEGVDVSWVQRAVSSLSQPGSSVVIIFDCCHSGGANVRSQGISFTTITPDDLPPISGVGRVLMAACTSDQKSMEVEIDGSIHGVFTYHLCEAIQGHAADDNNEVTIHSAYGYIVEQLKKKQNQIPVFKGDMEGQILFAQSVKKVGSWHQNINSNQPTIEEAVQRGESLLSQILPFATPTSHHNWLSSGYLEACQKFEPTLTWFQRRISTQPELKINSDFSSLYASCLQIYKSLGSVMPGMKIRQGIVGMPLGSGTFGTVFNINCPNKEDPICFKVYHSHDLNDAQKVGRFKRGYLAMKQLDHPKIVKVRELSEIPLGFFMDYIEGANSRNFNPGATQEPEIVVDLLLEIAETLQHAHTRGVIHRDVKPENILIKISGNGDSSAYLTDFDLSWFSAATQLTKLAEGFGSHFYAAPEQINNPNTPVAQKSTVDAYSFGQLCFFFVTGRDPLAFNPEGNARAIDQELSRKWTDSSAAAEFAKLYRECTRLAPDKRTSDFRIICEQLAQILLLLRSPNAIYDTPTFIEQTRFTLSGEIDIKRNQESSCIFRSRSGRTEVSIRAIKDSSTVLGLEVVFRPDDIIMEGRTSHDARVKINSRIDAMLNEYQKKHDAKRSGAKSGAFEATVRIDHLRKERGGVLIAREIVAKVLDLLEHT